MKNFILFIVLLTAAFSFSQYSQIQFKEGTFDNGMLYPIAISPGFPEVANMINEDLQKQISDLKDSDFCVGQYGYVQKANMIQIHIFCNCIDFKESQNRYFLYNVDNGKSMENMEMINEKKKSRFSAYFLAKVKEHCKSNNIELNDKEMNELKDNLLNSFDLFFAKNGISLSLNDNWKEHQLFISWEDLKPFLKFH